MKYSGNLAAQFAWHESRGRADEKAIATQPIRESISL
jgi:hypothetical protein